MLVSRLSPSTCLRPSAFCDRPLSAILDSALVLGKGVGFLQLVILPLGMATVSCSTELIKRELLLVGGT